MAAIPYPNMAGPTGPAGPAATLPQGLDTTDSPEFAGLTLSGPGSGVGTALVRDGGGVVLDLTSTRESKENIRAMSSCVSLSALMALKPVAYNYKGQDPEEDVSFGFIAEDVAAVCPDLVIYKGKKPYSLQYSEFIPLLVMAYQNQQNLIGMLEGSSISPMKRIASLDQKLNATETRLAELSLWRTRASLAILILALLCGGMGIWAALT